MHLFILATVVASLVGAVPAHQYEPPTYHSLEIVKVSGGIGALNGYKI